MRYKDKGTEGARQLMIDLLHDEELANKIQTAFEDLGGVMNFSADLNEIYHDLMDTVTGKGERARQWNELGSDQLLELWIDDTLESLEELHDIMVLNDEQQKKYDNLLSLLLNI